MPQQALRVGYPNTAKHHVIAAAEWMHIESEARAHVIQLRELHSSGTGKILVRRELHIARLAGKCAHLDACPFRQSGIIPEIIETCRLPSFVSVQKWRERKGLGSLRHAQTRSIKRAGNYALCIDRLHRVGRRNHRNGSPAGLCGFDRAPDESFRSKRSRTVVDKNEIRS